MRLGRERGGGEGQWLNQPVTAREVKNDGFGEIGTI